MKLLLLLMLIAGENKVYMVLLYPSDINNQYRRDLGEVLANDEVIEEQLKVVGIHWYAYDFDNKVIEKLRYRPYIVDGKPVLIMYDTMGKLYFKVYPPLTVDGVMGLVKQ